MSRIFEVNYLKLGRLMVWPHLRQRKHVKWVQGLVSAVNFLYQLFRKNRDANIYRLKITPQVVYLERMLNDKYDISDRRVRIMDSITYDPVYIFLEQERKPVHIFTQPENQPIYIYTFAETTIDPVNFVVIVPSDIIFQEAEMRGVLDVYRLAGKTYSIIRQ